MGQDTAKRAEADVCLLSSPTSVEQRNTILDAAR